ncbi:hypothetical protein HDV06_006987 [Boothiomyces sp. JEL0866]|nr:hypothetical protein HDV06_006987 [Boothiomyces sp. JEL0866]
MKNPPAKNKVIEKNAHYRRTAVLNEIKRLATAFEKAQDGSGTINKEQFKAVLSANVIHWSAGAQLLFLERLFDAFDVDRSGTIDYNEFITGLTVYFEGTEIQKSECKNLLILVTFQIYDIDKSGDIQPKELVKIMAEMYSSYYKTDKTDEVQKIVHQVFEDLDINGDGSLVFFD